MDLRNKNQISRDIITSFGIVNIKLTDVEGEIFLREKFASGLDNDKIITSKKYPEIKCYISEKNSYSKPTKNNILSYEPIKYNDTSLDIHKFWYYKNKIKFLMVSRNFSLGLVEFIRGKYNISDTKMIIELFEQMYENEIRFISENNYDDILYYFQNRHNEDKETVLNRMYEGKYSCEYCEAKMKFNMLLNPKNYPDNDIMLPLYFYTNNVKPKWKGTEWGFPKGRKDKKTEENINCACREFEEETGYIKGDYLILDKLDPMEEIMVGTNGIIYKHIYYLSLEIDNNIDPPVIPIDKKYDKYEIGDVKWFTYEEAISHIRPYHNKKKQILTNIFQFIIGHLIHTR